jgi:hypothetical protein
MEKKCGCCLADPFGAPRENCSRCGGTGFIENGKAIKPKSETPEEFEKRLQWVKAGGKKRADIFKAWDDLARRNKS